MEMHLFFAKQIYFVRKQTENIHYISSFMMEVFDLHSQLICNLLKLFHFLVCKCFLPSQEIHVNCLFLWPLIGHSMSDSFQDALARCQILVIHIQSFPLPFEYFGLHLPFQVYS